MLCLFYGSGRGRYLNVCKAAMSLPQGVFAKYGLKYVSEADSFDWEGLRIREKEPRQNEAPCHLF